MSKGLGKIQRAILAHLSDGGWAYAADLPYVVFEIDLDDYRSTQRPTEAQCKTVYRALDRLARIGVVEKIYDRTQASGKRRGPMTYNERWGQGNGIPEREPSYGLATCIKVRLSVESKEALPKTVKVLK